MDNESKLTWLAGFSHFITHGYMTLLPAVLVVIATENSMSFMDIGIIANIGYFLYGLGSFPAGYLADKIGSKRMLTIGVLGMAISSIMVSLSQGIIGFAITYAFLGLFASIHHPAGLSLIARRVTTKKGKALGLHGVMGNVGLFLTPLIASLGVMYFRTWRAAYLIYGLLGIGFGLILYLARVDEEHDLSFRELFALPGKILLGSGKKAAKEPSAREDSINVLPVALLALYLGSILSGFIFRGSLTFFPSLLQQEVHFITSHDEPVVMAGYFTTAVLSFGLFGSWFGGWINDKLKRPELFPVGVFVVVAPLLFMISRLTDSWLLAVACLFSLIYYSWQPAQNYLIAKYTRKASHGMGFGVNFFLIFGMGSIATSIGGYVADDFGIDHFYLIMSFIGAGAVLAAYSVWLARRHMIRFSWRLVRDDK